MTEQSIKRRRRQRAQESGNLIPVTLRMTAQDRDQMERAAHLRGSSLSEWLRDVIDEHKTGVSLNLRIDRLEGQLQELVGNQTSERAEFLKLTQNIEQQMTGLNQRMVTTTSSVDQFTHLIQTSFEQLFQAFFKLQAYIENIVKMPGGRK